MSAPHYHGTCTMYAPQCRTLEEILGLCSRNGGLAQEPHSDAMGCRQDCIRGPAGEDAILNASSCVRMLAFRAGSENEKQDPGFHCHSRYIRCVPHIDLAGHQMGSI